MLYKIAHLLRDKLGWLWNIIEWLNEVIFCMRYSKKLKNLILSAVSFMAEAFVAGWLT